MCHLSQSCWAVHSEAGLTSAPVRFGAVLYVIGHVQSGLSVAYCVSECVLQ